jgi:hypothetical protein
MPLPTGLQFLVGKISILSDEKIAVFLKGGVLRNQVL